MSARTDTVTDVRPGDFVMHAGKRTMVKDVDPRQGVWVQLDVAVVEYRDQTDIKIFSQKTGDYVGMQEIRKPVSNNYWPNWWPISTLHSLDCQCFAVHS